MSRKTEQWNDFGDAVREHIEFYVIPQYGDIGSDLATDYSTEDCIKQAQKYLARHNTRRREGEGRLDLVKAAHYMQMAWSKMS